MASDHPSRVILGMEIILKNLDGFCGEDFIAVASESGGEGRKEEKMEKEMEEKWEKGFEEFRMKYDTSWLLHPMIDREKMIANDFYKEACRKRQEEIEKLEGRWYQLKVTLQNDYKQGHHLKAGRALMLMDEYELV